MLLPTGGLLIGRQRIMCWWGIWTLAVAPSVSGSVTSASRSAQLGALVSPLFTMVYVSLHPPPWPRTLPSNPPRSPQPPPLRLWRPHGRETRRAAVLPPVVPRRRLRGRLRRARAPPGERRVGELQGVPRADVHPAPAAARAVPRAAGVGEEDGAAGPADV